MFSLTPEEKEELLRLLKLAHSCDQLYVYNENGLYMRPAVLKEDHDGDVIIYLEDSE